MHKWGGAPKQFTRMPSQLSTLDMQAMPAPGIRGLNMATEKTWAIVLRVIDFSETSCIVTLFTRDFGKIGALAKGARRPKSSFESALDLLAVCRIVFLHKSSDALDLLTEAKLERRFRAASRDLSRLYAGYYVAELLRELTDFGDPHPDLYAIAEQTLRRLDTDQAVFRLVLRFEMAALRLLGHLPALGACASCGKPIDKSTARVPFGVQAGGVLCPRCRPGQRQVVSVTVRSLNTLELFADSNPDGWHQVALDRATQGELRGVVNRFLSHLLGRPPRLHQFLGSLLGS